MKVQNGGDFTALANELSQDPGSQENGGDLGFVKKGVFVPEFDAVLFSASLGDNTVYSSLVESQFGYHIIKKIEERGTGDERERTRFPYLVSKVFGD